MHQFNYFLRHTVIGIAFILFSTNSYADYSIPKPDAYFCGSDNTKAWLTPQEALNDWGAKVISTYPQFTNWWILYSEPYYHCIADNGLPRGTQGYNGAGDFLNKGKRCQYQTGLGNTVNLGTDYAFSGPDGALNLVCIVATAVNPKDFYSCQKEGNPIHPSVGNKTQEETDFRLGRLEFTRYYNSLGSPADVVIGAKWRHNFSQRINMGRSPGSQVYEALLLRPNGSLFQFRLQGSNWLPDQDFVGKLIEQKDGNGVRTGWHHIRYDDSIELFDANGRLVSITNRSGYEQTLAYDSQERLYTVTDSFGRKITFSYDKYNRISEITDPAGSPWQYTYDRSANLESVIYPNSKKRIYHYNEPAYVNGSNIPNALTGITDENNVRFATWYYDSQGRAYSSEHAGNVEKVTVVHNANGSKTVIDPLGTARTTHFTTILGVTKATGQSQPGGSGCGPASSVVTHDANGNVASRTDFNGAKVCYAYDLARNLETARVEGLAASADCAAALSSSSLAAPARKVTTQWHPQYRLPTLIAEPQRLTRHEHEANGNVLTRTMWSTTDATGASGAAANTVGAPRKWSYTYNQYGQVLTATGPRTDVADTTTYAYDDATGNLVTVTNAAGHVTTFSNYDANGRVGRMVDANGLTTDLEYTPRGWLKTRTVSGNGVNELTTYDYDGVGQLKKVSLPDGSWVGYTYDDAHRLTDIADSAGNRITYQLDAMGNRTREEVKDPNGALARQTSRIYDALNRLQQITGGMQ